VSWFHRHTWKEVARTYARPTAAIGNGRLRVRGDVDDAILVRMMERSTSGVTTIAWQCTDPKCGHTRVVEMLGKEIT